MLFTNTEFLRFSVFNSVEEGHIMDTMILKKIIFLIIENVDLNLITHRFFWFKIYKISGQPGLLFLPISLVLFVSLPELWHSNRPTDSS